MSETTADVETSTLGQMRDEMKALDEAQEMQGLETMLKQELGTADTSPERAEPEAETEATSAKAKATPPKRTGGIAAALETLENNNPELAEAVRAQIRDNNALRDTVKGFKQELESAVRAAVAEAVKAEEEAVQAPQGEYTPEQIAQAKERARRMGFVLKEDLEAEQKRGTFFEYINEGKEKAYDEFGETFGTKDEDGRVHISEGAEQAMVRELNRIKQYGNLNPRDLHILANYDDLIKQAESRGLQKGRAAAGNLSEDRWRAGVTSRTTTGEPVPQIRGEVGTESDAKEAVMRRAFLAATKKLGIAS